MPPFPKPLHYLWTIYRRIRRRNAGGFGGAEPVGWPAIAAFVGLTGIRLAPWEVELLEALDDIYLDPDPAPPAMPQGVKVKTAASPDDHAGVQSVLAGVGKGRRVVKRTPKGA
jgi:hypothetical protein